MPENKRFQAQQIGDAARVIDTEVFFLVEGRPKTVEWFNSFEEAQAEADKLNRTYGHASDEPKCEGYYYYRCGACDYIIKSVPGTGKRKRIRCKYCKSLITPIGTITRYEATTPSNPLVRQGRKQITKSTRKDLLNQFNANGRICALCDKVVEAHEKLHLDHILPVSEGGTDDISNLQYVHANCNLRRSNMTVNDGKKYIRLGDLRAVTRSMSQSSNMAIRNGENPSVRAVVAWNDQKEKWQAQIAINDRLEHLGYYKYKKNALNAYQDALNESRKDISLFEGVRWIIRRKKMQYQAQVWIDGRLEHLGYYEDEETAHEVYQKARANRGEA